MKRTLLALTGALAIGCGAMWGVPACPHPGIIHQPDGTPITVRLHGDEFINYITTDDGYTLMKNTSGIYTYAERSADGTLQPGHIAASDAARRDASTKVYLAGLQKYLAPAPTSTAEAMLADRSRIAVQPGQRGLYDYKKFKGLVILAEYNDRPFSRPDVDTVFTQMITKKNFDGFMSTDATPKKLNYTGSVRDYFYDNSYGMFDPDFDVVGPVKIPYSQFYAQQETNARTLVKAACEAADSFVDFTKYDTDKDGVVDMVYIIFSGGGSNYTANNQKLIWPHAWTLPDTQLDGVTFGRYACSTELFGLESDKNIDGIGTICHEFSHVLGLMDEYDSDYSANGQSHDPGYWSVMSVGSYLNNSITPCGYSLLERYQSGFSVPEILNTPGKYTLGDIDATNKGYRISLPDRDNEYWLLENRRKKGNKWNAYVPGEGMLVFRVDSTDTFFWSANKINAYSEHNFYEMVRAYNNTKTTDRVRDLDSDPFPGTHNVTELSTKTSPALKAWNKDEPNVYLTSIAETENGDITFQLNAMDSTDTRFEDWENITTPTAYETRVAGNVGRWTFENAAVDSPASTYCSGEKALGMAKGSIATVGPVYGRVKKVKFTAFNSSIRGAYVQLQYKDSTDNWVNVSNLTGSSSTSVPANSKATPTFMLPDNLPRDRHLRIVATQGDTSRKIFVDDIEVTMIKDEEYVGITGAVEDSNSLCWTATASELRITGEEGSRVDIYNINGAKVAGGVIQCGAAVFARPASGIYVAVTASGSIKIML